MASLLFCSECQNMLYPKEDRQNRILNYACRNCNNEISTDLEHHCVFRNLIKQEAIDQTRSNIDLSSDPTYPRRIAKSPDEECPQCGNSEAIYFQSKAKGPDTTMQLYFVCCNSDCRNRWTVAPEEQDGM